MDVSSVRSLFIFYPQNATAEVVKPSRKKVAVPEATVPGETEGKDVDDDKDEGKVNEGKEEDDGQDGDINEGKDTNDDEGKNDEGKDDAEDASDDEEGKSSSK